MDLPDPFGARTPKISHGWMNCVHLFESDDLLAFGAEESCLLILLEENLAYLFEFHSRNSHSSSLEIDEEGNQPVTGG